MQRPLLPQYDAAVAAKLIEHDSQQRALAQQLEMLGKEMEEAAARGFFAKIFHSHRPRGLYVWGGVGRGKTMLMDMFFANVSVPQKKRAHFHAFMRDVHQSIFEERQKDTKDPLIAVARDIAETVQLLCFDEFAVTDVADAMILSRLFTVLFEKGVVVVATSNIAPEDLYKDGLNRPLFLPFVDLLQKNMNVLKLMSAKDYRLQKFEKTGVYFVGTASAEKFNAAWRAFLHGVDEESAVLKVKGRSLVFARTGAGGLRASFEELCAATLGTEDYLEIAHSFHTVFVEGVPAFRPEHRNQLRRFINLIDILYDAQVNLVALAADEPDSLVKDMDGYEDKAFARTASRLTEMRSSDYLAKAHAPPLRNA